jgi:hypothetical protein
MKTPLVGPSARTRALLACGVIGPLLFISVFLLEGATRPGYSAWRHVVSALIPTRVLSSIIERSQ